MAMVPQWLPGRMLRSRLSTLNRKDWGKLGKGFNQKRSIVIGRLQFLSHRKLISHVSTSSLGADTYFLHCDKYQYRVLSGGSVFRGEKAITTGSKSELDFDNVSSKSSLHTEETQRERMDVYEVLENIQSAALYNQGKNNKTNRREKKHWDIRFCREAVRNYQTCLEQWGESKETDLEDDLVSEPVVVQAFSTLLRCNWPPKELSKRVRDLERLIGTIGETPLTDELSLKLLEANAKAGNVGRTLSLLELRKSYPPQYPREFLLSLQAIHSASLELRKNRNIFLGEDQQPSIDNPTRFLDAILMNMHHRNVPLEPPFAAKLLKCFACSGRSGKALHAHYKIVVTKPQKESPEGAKPKISMKWNRPPPFYKIPSQINQEQLVKMPGYKEQMTKYEWECREDYWSRSLDAAFSFCDSLQHGVGGYNPIELDIEGWNAMIKICCHRGAIWRALQIFREIIPKKNLEPNGKSYLFLLQALARLGDISTMRELWDKLLIDQVELNPYLIEAMVDGLLNKGNVAGSITLCQDVWNQVHIQPPYTTHLKILEFALANDYLYEAKRYIYVLQQIWMTTGQVHPKLSKAALSHLFQYFGYKLTEDDFLTEFRHNI